jgi:hypothetical protein
VAKKPYPTWIPDQVLSRTPLRDGNDNKIRRNA